MADLAPETQQGAFPQFREHAAALRAGERHRYPLLIPRNVDRHVIAKRRRLFSGHRPRRLYRSLRSQAAQERPHRPQLGHVIRIDIGQDALRHPISPPNLPAQHHPEPLMDQSTPELIASTGTLSFTHHSALSFAGHSERQKETDRRARRRGWDRA